MAFLENEDGSVGDSAAGKLDQTVLAPTDVNATLGAVTFELSSFVRDTYPNLTLPTSGRPAAAAAVAAVREQRFGVLATPVDDRVTDLAELDLICLELDSTGAFAPSAGISEAATITADSATGDVTADCNVKRVGSFAVAARSTVITAPPATAPPASFNATVRPQNEAFASGYNATESLTISLSSIGAILVLVLIVAVVGIYVKPLEKLRRAMALRDMERNAGLHSWGGAHGAAAGLGEDPAASSEARLLGEVPSVADQVNNTSKSLDRHASFGVGQSTAMMRQPLEHLPSHHGGGGNFSAATRGVGGGVPIQGAAAAAFATPRRLVIDEELELIVSSRRSHGNTAANNSKSVDDDPTPWL